MPFLPLEHPEALAAIGATAAARHAADIGRAATEASRRRGSGGAARGLQQPDGVRRQGSLEQTYDKIHLVPFGEYLPMQGLLESIGLSS